MNDSYIPIYIRETLNCIDILAIAISSLEKDWKTRYTLLANAKSELAADIDTIWKIAWRGSCPRCSQRRLLYILGGSKKEREIYIYYVARGYELQVADLATSAIWPFSGPTAYNWSVNLGQIERNFAKPQARVSFIEVDAIFITKENIIQDRREREKFL